MVTPKFTIEKTCVSLKKGYLTNIAVAATSKSMKRPVALPFLNLESKDDCGVKKIEIKKTLDKSNFVTFPAEGKNLANCPGPKCNFIDVETSKEGNFKFIASATLNNGVVVTTKEFSGAVGCSTSAPKLTAPKYKAGSLYHLDPTPYDFLPFTTSNSNFPTCGFKEYTITAINKATRKAVKVDYPPKDNKVKCDTLTSCLKASIDTSQLGTITLTISATTYEPRTVKTTVDILIKPCSPIKSSYPSTFVVDAAKPGTDKYKFKLPLTGLKGACAVRSISFIYLSDRYRVVYPKVTSDGEVLIDRTRLASFRLRVRVLTTSGKSFYTNYLTG